MGGWSIVTQDASREDQVTGNYDPDKGSVTITALQTYAVVTDGTWRGTAVEAMTASASGNTMPALGDDLTIGGIDFTVTQVQPRRNGANSFECQVQSQYVFQPPQTGNTWNVQVSFGGTSTTQDAYQDMNGNAITNSAGQPYDPSVKETIYDEHITISYQTTVEQSASFDSVRGKVNSSSVTLSLPGLSRTFATRTLRCDDATQSASIPLSGGTDTFTVNLEFTCRADSFQDSIIDQGFYTSDPTTGELVQIKDKYGDLLSAPALLDGNGDLLAAGANPVYNTYKIEKEADFTSFFEGLA